MRPLVALVALCFATPLIARDCSRVTCVMCAVRYGPPAGYELYRGGRGERYGGWSMRRITTPAVRQQTYTPVVKTIATPKPIDKQDPITTFAPTPMEAVDAMLDIAKVTADDVVFDPGCGDGRIPIRAAERFGATGTGIEINPDTFKLAEAALAKLPVKNRVQLYRGDATEWTIKEATVVALYLYGDVIKKIIPSFRMMKPGTRIVSYQHDLPGLPTRRIELNGHTYYLHILGE